MIIRSDALKIPLRDNSAHCFITSPPYWRLRDYKVRGQIGLERRVERYLEKMVVVFREVRRVLRPDGTLWLNMGDTFASGQGTCQNPGGRETSFHEYTKGHGAHPLDRGNVSELRESGLKPLDLVGVPWRLALALQADGWYLRRDIIWDKTNPMPESVQGTHWAPHKIHVREGKKTKFIDCPGCEKCSPNDGLVLTWSAGRPATSHEYVFYLTKSDQYFYDAEAVKEKVTGNAHPRGTGLHVKVKTLPKEWNVKENEGWAMATTGLVSSRNLRSVWTIATQAFSGAHFATFPEELVRRALFAGTSEAGCCRKCGAPRVRVMGGGKRSIPDGAFLDHSMDAIVGRSRNSLGGQKEWDLYEPPTTIGWRPSCGCFGECWAIPDYKPCLVVDPFGGTGTVGVVAQRYRRAFVGLDLKWEYCKMAELRIKNSDVPML